jgi:hypothetical protein
MTLGISSFMMNRHVEYGDASVRTLNWGKSLLSNFASTLVLASGGNYQIDDPIKIIGRSMTEDGYYCRHTIQLKNDYTGEYLRIWCINDPYNGLNMIDTAGSNSSRDDCKIYKGNFLCQGINHNVYYYHNCLFFAVKDASIDTDPAGDLGLSFPMFSLCNGLWATTHCYSTNLVSDFKSKYTITSDGSGFTFLYHGFYPYNQSPQYPCSCRGLVYHPQAINTISGDSNTKGVYLLSTDSSSYTPYDGDGVTKLRGYWVSAGGAISYEQFLNSLDPVSATTVTVKGDKVSCIPLALFSEPDNYNVNQSYLNATGTGAGGSNPDNSIGFKGYTNQNLIRRCSAQRVVNVGATYGGWMCIGPGWLVPWATGHDADSPFIDSSAIQSGGGDGEG